MRRPYLLYPHPAPRSLAHHLTTSFAAPWLHAKARASKRRALRPWSGSPALPWDESARQQHSSRWSESRRQGEGRGSVWTWCHGRPGIRSRCQNKGYAHHAENNCPRRRRMTGNKPRSIIVRVPITPALEVDIVSRLCVTQVPDIIQRNLDFALEWKAFTHLDAISPPNVRI
jgi:hypothetical protein